MSSDIPLGLSFSQAYLRPAKPLQDGGRFRLRLLALFETMSFSGEELADLLRAEAGIEVPGNGQRLHWDLFFKHQEIADILDAIGMVPVLLGHGQQFAHWKGEISRIFQEQAMAYRLDKAGAVRKLIDADFERNQYAAIAGLGRRKYKVAKDYFDRAVHALEASPTDTAGMVRYVFLANEEIFKLKYGVDRLTASTARNHLQPEVKAATQAAKSALTEMANSFARWAAAAQQYRHAPGEAHDGDESPAAPPLDLAIVMMSAGTSFLRWLIALDGKP